MRRRNQVLLFVILVFLLALAVPALAQGGYGPLEWWSTDGGGDTITGNGYALNVTIGQPEAGTPRISGGDYAIANGYWTRTGDTSGGGDNFLYLPAIERGQ